MICTFSVTKDNLGNLNATITTTNSRRSGFRSLKTRSDQLRSNVLHLELAAPKNWMPGIPLAETTAYRVGAHDGNIFNIEIFYHEMNQVAVSTLYQKVNITLLKCSHFYILCYYCCWYRLVDTTVAIQTKVGLYNTTSATLLRTTTARIGTTTVATANIAHMKLDEYLL